ncbi:MAG: 30S ribosome-binding factor RbfA [Undibacterium sp.]|nr:30S ribosome-binding factor RbfA [Opitutaceae bacterium]
MSNRTVRINELIHRELNDILRRRYQTEAVAITVTEVRISTDLRDGKAFVAILGDDELIIRRMAWLRRQARDIRAELALRITLKFLPKLTYAIDETTPRSAKVLQMLDDMVKANPSLAELPTPPTAEPAPPSPTP